MLPRLRGARSIVNAVSHQLPMEVHVDFAVCKMDLGNAFLPSISVYRCQDFVSITCSFLGRYSDSLRAGRSGYRIPMGARFSAPVHTGPVAQPASCTMGTGSFPGVKRPGRGADHPPPSKCRGQERVELYLYSPSGPSWPVMGAPLSLPYMFFQLIQHFYLQYPH